MRNLSIIFYLIFIVLFSQCERSVNPIEVDLNFKITNKLTVYKNTEIEKEFFFSDSSLLIKEINYANNEYVDSNVFFYNNLKKLDYYINYNKDYIDTNYASYKDSRMWIKGSRCSLFFNYINEYDLGLACSELSYVFTFENNNVIVNNFSGPIFGYDSLKYDNMINPYSFFHYPLSIEIRYFSYNNMVEEKKYTKRCRSTCEFDCDDWICSELFEDYKFNYLYNENGVPILCKKIDNNTGETLEIIEYVFEKL